MVITALVANGRSAPISAGHASSSVRSCPRMSLTNGWGPPRFIWLQWRLRWQAELRSLPVRFCMSIIAQLRRSRGSCVARAVVSCQAKPRASSIRICAACVVAVPPGTMAAEDLVAFVPPLAWRPVSVLGSRLPLGCREFLLVLHCRDARVWNGPRQPGPRVCSETFGRQASSDRVCGVQ